MIPSPAATPGLSLMTIECGVTAIAIGLGFAWPSFGCNWIARVERAFGDLAKRKGLAITAVGFTCLGLRLAILPLTPIPKPFIPDDFSFLLAANTFAAGRLTNPTPAMWTHFESFHITMTPTYMSMYFPAPGLVLAAGKVLFGHPWYGLLCVTSLMCAAICWMLQAWLPPGWALLGGMLAVLRLGLFSYWINSYTGGASAAALGGALVLGALPRVMKAMSRRDCTLLALGICLLALSRPYEGLLLCLPVAIALGRWAFFGKDRPSISVLFRCSAFPLSLVVASGLWLGYYDSRVSGNPLTLPYSVDRATYAVAPYWIWQSPRPQPVYRHKIMQHFYMHSELSVVDEIHTVPGFFSHAFGKAYLTLSFFAGVLLWVPLAMLPRVLKDARIRFLIMSSVFWAVGMLIGFFMLPHYLAPFTAGFYAIGLQCMRHLRSLHVNGKPLGIALTRLIVISCICMAALRAAAEPLHIGYASWPGIDWVLSWSGPGRFGDARAKVERELEQMPGNQLAIVRYSPAHDDLAEWVYNSPDIDGSKVIWAREMDAENNMELISYYKGRRVWLIQPDATPAILSPYPMSVQVTAAAP